jgi:hypothetical protein
MDILCYAKKRFIKILKNKLRDEALEKTEEDKNLIKENVKIDVILNVVN